ncbi:transposase [Streptomyces sp. NPDC054804]
MRTTSNTGDRQHPDFEHNRDQAWARLTLAHSGGRRLPSRSGGSPGRLMDIARNYDRICQWAEGTLLPDATDADVLAALLVIRMLREKLDHDELKLTSLARTRKITWARIAQWQELSGRQAAERRHLWLTLRIVSRPKGTKGFVVLPRRWKVERTIGWCMNARRNARDYERLPQHSEAHLNWALITMMTRRLTRKSPRTDTWSRKPQATQG